LFFLPLVSSDPGCFSPELWDSLSVICPPRLCRVRAAWSTLLYSDLGASLPQFDFSLHIFLMAWPFLPNIPGLRFPHL
jgi:hypothetical protein